MLDNSIIVVCEFNDLTYSSFGYTNTLYFLQYKYIKAHDDRRRSLNQIVGNLSLKTNPIAIALFRM